MKNKGRIVAMDTEQWKLDELQKRARRAGVSNMEAKVIESGKTIKRLANSADRLLLDVPCSGLGVLKRNPDAKWKLSLDFVNKIRELQQHIIGDYCDMLKPGGLMVVSTLNRNWKSFALAIVGAEYVLRWLPRGTHQWDKFVTPDELAHHLHANKLAITEQAGVVYSPFADKWSLSSDMDVNYMVVAEGL